MVASILAAGADGASGAVVAAGSDPLPAAGVVGTFNGDETVVPESVAAAQLNELAGKSVNAGSNQVRWITPVASAVTLEPVVGVVPIEFCSFTTTEYIALAVRPEMTAAVPQLAGPWQATELTPVAAAGAVALEVIETVCEGAGA